MSNSDVFNVLALNEETVLAADFFLFYFFIKVNKIR
jgi:hypothetical protein